MGEMATYRELLAQVKDEIDEVVLALAGGGVELEVPRDLAELGHAHLAEVADLEVVPLTGGLELLLLLEFGDGSAASADGIAAAGPAVARSIALVWAWSGHMGRVTYG